MFVHLLLKEVIGLLLMGQPYLWLVMVLAQGRSFTLLMANTHAINEFIVYKILST